MQRSLKIYFKDLKDLAQVLDGPVEIPGDFKEILADFKESYDTVEARWFL